MEKQSADQELRRLPIGGVGDCFLSIVKQERDKQSDRKNPSDFFTWTMRYARHARFCGFRRVPAMTILGSIAARQVLSS